MAVLENGFPFDNVEYDATALGAWLSTRTRGVFSDDEHYAVTVIGGMQVSVSSGMAWLKMNEQWGMVAPNPAAITLSVDVGDTILNRIDVVCLRIDKNQSTEEVVIKKGELAATPVYPALVRDLNYDEIFLAAISVPAGTTELNAALITDLRGNETYCGIMRDGVTGIPTALLQAQAEALIELLEDAIAGVIDGSQYMLKAGYDQDNTVADAGGIVPYLDSQLANKASKDELAIYSSDERKVGKWFDDNLYEKTLAITNTFQGSTTEFRSIPHGIDGMGNIYWVENAFCMPPNGNSLTISRAAYNPSVNIFADVNKTNILFASGTTWSGMLYFTVRYTKAG